MLINGTPFDGQSYNHRTRHEEHTFINLIYCAKYRLFVYTCT